MSVSWKSGHGRGLCTEQAPRGWLKVCVRWGVAGKCVCVCVCVAGEGVFVCRCIALSQWQRNYLAETFSNGKKLQNRSTSLR